MQSIHKHTSVTRAWAWLSPSINDSSARLGMIDTSSSVPRHYPGTLSPAGSRRSQHNVGVSLRRSRRCDLKLKTIGGRREGERILAIPITLVDLNAHSATAQIGR